MRHRLYYYELLNNVRLTGDWEAGLDFFAEAVIVTATSRIRIGGSKHANTFV